MECNLIANKTEDEEREICLRCPYEDCLYMLEPRAIKHARTLQRNSRILVELKAGQQLQALSKKYGIGIKRLRQIIQENVAVETL